LYDADPLAAERIREALSRPVEEREKIDLPKPKPVETLERCRLKPLPVHGKKGVIPR
jgi:hypothetical protein